MNRPRELTLHRAGIQVVTMRTDAATPLSRGNAAVMTMAGAFLFVFVSVYALPLSTPTLGRVSAVLFLVPIAFSIALLLKVSRSTDGKERKMWQGLGIAMTFFLAGMVYRAYYVFLFGVHPGPGSIEDAIFITGFLAAAPAVVFLTEPYEVGLLRRVRTMLDMATIVMATFAVVYMLSILEFEEARALNSSQANTFSVIYTVITYSFVIFLLTFKRERWRPWEFLILGAAVSAAIGVSMKAALWPHHLYYPGAPAAAGVDGAWSISFLLLAIAASVRLAAPLKVRRPATPVFDPPHWPGIAAMTVALVGVPLLVFIAPQLRETISQTLVSVTASLIAGLAVAKSAIVGVENRQLADLVPTDALTGLGNLPTLCRTVDAAVERAGREGEITLVIFDIDRFERTNNTFGYSAGDSILRRIAREMQLLEDQEISAYRIGGDDFALLMSNTGAVEAYEAASAFCERVAVWSTEGVPGVSMSVGIASFPMHTEDPRELTRIAEGAAYHAKTLGGEQIVVYDPHVVDVLDHYEHIAMLENRTHTTMVESLAAAVDARDPYTQYHSRNVAQLVAFLCRELGMPEDRVSLLHSAALLHDVGKIGIPDSVLKKNGPLNAEERRLIEQHPDLGVEILHASVRQEILPWVHAHHERPDGRGYPRGLTGDEIPFEAKLLAICDAFDAMTTDRPYRKGLSVYEAVAELKRVAGTQLDADLVEVFIVLVAAGRASDVVLEPGHPDLRLTS